MDQDLARKAVKAAINKTASSPVEDIRAALKPLSYLTNGVAAWHDAHAGNDALAKQNAKKVKEAEQLLSEVLASMPQAVTYEVAGLADSGPGRYLTFKDADDLIAGMKHQGIRLTGYSPTGRLRPELQGQPKFDSLLGPMYGGPGKVRYETQKRYDELSQ